MLYYNSPGSLINYYLLLEKLNINTDENDPKTIASFIENYKLNKDPENLNIIHFLIEKLYNNLCIKNISNSDKFFFERDGILKNLSDMKKFNLDEKNVFSLIKDTLLNYAK